MRYIYNFIQFAKFVRYLRYIKCWLQYCTPKPTEIDKEIVDIIKLCNITLICVTLVLGFKSVGNSLSLEDLDFFYLRLDL